MTIQQLRCFVSVARNLSFQKAAEELFITQPGVSHHIKALENELGAQLIRRDNRIVSLTPAGERYLIEVSDILSHLDQANNILNDAHSLPRYIHLGFENTVEVFKLAGIISEFGRSCPNVRFSCKGLTIPQIIKSMNDNKLDVVFTTHTDLGKSVDFTPLFSGQFCCLMRRDNPLSSKDTIDLADLEGQTLIFPEAHATVPQYTRMQRTIRTRYPGINLHFSNSSHLTFPLVEAGAGIVILPNFLISPHFSLSDSIVMRPVPALPKDEFGIAYHNYKRDDYVDEFIRITKKHYRKTVECQLMRERKSYR